MENIEIVKANHIDKDLAHNIATELKEWFSETGLKDMKVDFDCNNVVVAKENDRVVGFLCYTTYSGKCLLLWMGVVLSAQRKGVGQALIDWLVKECEILGLHSIEVETLPDEDDYETYKQTRDFYYKNGFERIMYKKARIEGWDDQIVLEKKIQ